MVLSCWLQLVGSYDMLFISWKWYIIITYIIFIFYGLFYMFLELLLVSQFQQLIISELFLPDSILCIGSVLVMPWAVPFAECRYPSMYQFFEKAWKESWKKEKCLVQCFYCSILGAKRPYTRHNGWHRP